MEDLQKEIKQRYKAETSCNLSCGTNLDYCELKAGEALLDLGSGKGKESLIAAGLVGEQGKVVGLDLTPEMVVVAKQNAQQAQVGNVEFVVGAIEDLPFEDNTFDVVISNCVINHAKDKTKVYREISRVLKKGGRFVISDAVTKYPLPESIKDDPAQWAACFGGAITEEEYLHSIKSANFAQVEVLNRREYLKNGYDFISLTIRAYK